MSRTLYFIHRLARTTCEYQCALFEALGCNVEAGECIGGTLADCTREQLSKQLEGYVSALLYLISQVEACPGFKCFLGLVARAKTLVSAIRLAQVTLSPAAAPMDH